MAVSLKQHRALVARLKKLFGVAWDIQVRWGSEEEMVFNGDPCVGVIHMHQEEDSAVILMARGEGYATLIHEFMHILFDAHRDGKGSYDPMHERALNKTAAAVAKLMGLDA